MRVSSQWQKHVEAAQKYSERHLEWKAASQTYFKHSNSKQSGWIPTLASLPHHDVMDCQSETGSRIMNTHSVENIAEPPLSYIMLHRVVFLAMCSQTKRDFPPITSTSSPFHCSVSVCGENDLPKRKICVHEVI